MNDRVCGELVSLNASAPKSSSGVEGTMALSPVPVIGKANALRLSALVGLLTISVAVRGNGHKDGGAPAEDGELFPG